MTKFLKKTVSLLAAAAMSLSVLTAPVSADSIGTDQVGALLDSYTVGSGTFTVTADSRIFVVGDTEPTGNLLQTVQLIQRQFRAEFKNDSFGFELVWGDASWVKTGDIVLVLDASSGTGADGYKLNVNDTAATITADDVDGLIYGSNTLLKMFRAADGKSLSGFAAADTPDTKERSVQLDVARKYYTAEWIKNFIKQISWMGYNSLTLHFSEDGGFRADFWDSAYYKGEFQPENDFSWLCGSHVQSWVYDETLPDGTTGKFTKDPDAGKYLTTSELIEIINTAKEYHIELIPSFDSPAHMDYISWKFEQNYKSNKSYSFTYNDTTYKASSTSGCINYTGKTGASSPTWPYYTTIDITDGTMAKAFVFALYEDIADFFKEYAGSTKFAIGADEVNLSSKYNPKWSYSQFPGYVNELNRMLNKKGYTCRMFNDFIGSTTYNQSNDKAVYDFEDNIEIMYWNSDFNPTDNTYGGDDNKTWHVAFFWYDGTNTENAGNDWPENGWGDGGRTIYNCIQTNCYYVLRVGTSGNNRDARDPSNRNWTFYHSNEEAIYNEWYPADISEKGDYTENAADVPAAQLGGAYFLIWNDYAAVSTESEVWNGAVDAWHGENTYYLFDRMASNITKMWNSDVNNTVAYDKFAAVRDDVKAYFPGYTSCSAAASLPAVTDPVAAADFSALITLLEEGMISNGDYTYTEASYTDYVTKYQTAAENAENLLNNSSIKKADVEKAISDLNAAEDVLVAFDTTEADALLNNKLNSSLYTAESYVVYETAYNNLADKSNWKSQADLDALVIAVQTAEANLVEEEIENDTEFIYTVKSASAAVKAGKKVVLIIETDPEIETLAVEEVEQLALSISSVQTIGGKEVKVWMLKFVEDTKGEHRYAITGTAAEQTYTYTASVIKVY